CGSCGRCGTRVMAVVAHLAAESSVLVPELVVGALYEVGELIVPALVVTTLTNRGLTARNIVNVSWWERHQYFPSLSDNFGKACLQDGFILQKDCSPPYQREKALFSSRAGFLHQF